MSVKRTRVSYTLTDALIKRVQKVSKDTDIPMSRLVERALSAYLDEHHPEPLPPSKFMTYQSVSEQTEDAYKATFTTNRKPGHLLVDAIAKTYAPIQLENVPATYKGGQ